MLTLCCILLGLLVLAEAHMTAALIALEDPTR